MKYLILKYNPDFDRYLFHSIHDCVNDVLVEIRDCCIHNARVYALDLQFEVSYVDGKIFIN